MKFFTKNPNLKKIIFFLGGDGGGVGGGGGGGGGRGRGGGVGWRGLELVNFFTRNQNPSFFWGGGGLE